VMGRNLGADSLHGWLEKEEGWQVRRLSARSGYRLLRVTAFDEFERTGVTPNGQ
jgi:16S rRNA (guanine1207-N2)-methyltransferase